MREKHDDSCEEIKLAYCIRLTNTIEAFLNNLQVGVVYYNLVQLVTSWLSEILPFSCCKSEIFTT